MDAARLQWRSVDIQAGVITMQEIFKFEQQGVDVEVRSNDAPS